MGHLRVIILVLVLSGIVPLVVHAQGAGVEWEILHEEAGKLYRAGEYGRGVVVAQKALQVAEQNVGPEHRDAALSLNNLAALYRATKRIAEAKALEQRAARIRAIRR